MHFVAGKDFLPAAQSPWSIRDLIHLPFILTEKGMSYRRFLDEKLAEQSVEIRPILEIGSTDLICRLAEQGIGISFLPDFVTDERVREGPLVRLQVKDLEIKIWKQLLYHRDKWISPQMKSCSGLLRRKRISEKIEGGRMPPSILSVRTIILLRKDFSAVQIAVSCFCFALVSSQRSFAALSGFARFREL